MWALSNAHSVHIERSIFICSVRTNDARAFRVLSICLYSLPACKITQTKEDQRDDVKFLKSVSLPMLTSFYLWENRNHVFRKYANRSMVHSLSSIYKERVQKNAQSIYIPDSSSGVSVRQVQKKKKITEKTWPDYVIAIIYNYCTLVFV